MKLKLLLGLLAPGLAFPALAMESKFPNSHFGLLFRSDLIMHSEKPTEDTNSTHSRTYFGVPALKLNFDGNISDKTTFRVRYQLSQANTEMGPGHDGIGQSVEYAYVTHSFSDMLDVTFGKMYYGGICGREGDPNALDVYFYSDTCNGVGALGDGVSIQPSVAGQSFVVSLFNSKPSVMDMGTDGTSANAVGYDYQLNQATPAYSLSWYGDLANGMVQPIVNYSAYPHKAFKTSDGSEYLDRTDSHMAVGTRVTFGPAFVELDYMANKKAAELKGGKDKSMTGFVLAARFHAMGDKLQPHFKYSMDTSEDGDSDVKSTEDYKTTKMALAVEYYLSPEFRTHFAYVSSSQKFDDSALEKVESTQIILGVATSFTNG